MERVTLQLPLDMLRVAQRIARDQDITVGQLVRNLLAREISRINPARPPNRADEQLVAPLRARLANDLAFSETWEDLQSRLMLKGYKLHPAGGGLALHLHPGGERVCKASELGYGYGRLLSRFNTSFPGHTHIHLAQRYTKISPRRPEKDSDVIEPWRASENL